MEGGGTAVRGIRAQIQDGGTGCCAASSEQCRQRWCWVTKKTAIKLLHQAAAAAGANYLSCHYADYLFAIDLQRCNWAIKYFCTTP